jgi:signal transduction histidine kinase
MPKGDLHQRFALAAGALALVSLAGWALGLPLLTTFVPGRPSLSPMTAALLIVAALGVAALPRRCGASTALALVQAAAGLAIVAAHLVQLPQAGPLPMAWWTSRLSGGAFALSGLATVLLARGRSAGGQILALLLLAVTVLLGLGHLFPHADLYARLPGTGVAIPTVLAFVALSLGQLLSLGGLGVSAALSGRNAAGRAGRWLLLGGAGSVLALTAAAAVAYERGHFDATTAVLLVGWGAIALLGATLWSLAVAVDQAELARAEAQRDRHQVRQMVAAAVTHDLRSPLQAATLSAALLERLVADPAAQPALARLQRSHSRLDRLLRTLLDSLAVGEGQQLSMRPSQVQLDEVVREVVGENEPVLGHRVALEGTAQGWWDRDALFRVIENLLLNAAKYGDGSAAIACAIGQPQAHCVALTVTNQGPPVPQAEWEAIFEPFSRGERARQAHQVGWGVGLAYARSVATGHGGSVRVAASDARGTVFELRLPQDGRPYLGAA